MEERRLLREFVAQKSQRAFAILVTGYIDLVYSSAARQVGDVHLAEDVTQTVFIALAKKSAKLATGDAPLGPWLVAATRNAAMDALRKQYRRRHHEQKAAAMKTIETTFGDDQAWEQMRPYLDELLSNLGEADRTAIVLRFLEERPMREVGEAMGVSEDAAKQRVFRAVEKLRGMFARKGVALGAGAMGAAMTSYSVSAAPFGLAASATQAGLSAAGSGGGTLFLAKGLVKLVAIKTSHVAAAAAVVLLCGAGGALVYENQRPAAQQSVALADPAPPRPALAGAGAKEELPPVVEEPGWEERFQKEYRLGEGQVLKHVQPPYIPEREIYFQKVGFRPQDMNRGTVLLFDDGKNVAWNSWTMEMPGPSVGGVLKFIAGIPTYKLVMDDADRLRPIKGDWVVRKDAGEAERLAAIADVLLAEANWPVRFEKAKGKKKVWVASGTYDRAPVLGKDNDGVKLYVDPKAKPNGASVGSVKNFCVALGELMGVEVVSEVKVVGRDDVFWRNAVGPAVNGEFAAEMLNHVTEQTGIQFKQEEREVEWWEAKEGK